jgi:8-oxo-dGTP pyrophosphatase MutT (NUDIX family)
VRERLNGTGGKCGPGESVESAATRECQEEVGLRVAESSLLKHGVLEFRFVDCPRFDSECHVFSCEYNPEEQG